MIAVIIVLFLIIFDQLTKLAAINWLMPIKQRILIEGFFNLTYVENRGAAFGSMQGARWFFVVLAVLVVTGLSFYYRRIEKTKNTLPLRAAIILIVGGTLGNVIDRVFRSYVVDFLDFIIFGYDFPVFNAADVFIVIGTFLMAAYILLTDIKKEDKK